MDRQQRLVLVVSILASFVAFIDGAIVGVALPAIQRELGGGLTAQQWIVDAYLLTLGSLILIAGSLSDLLGRKKILSLGLIGFAIASVLCAIAPNITLLIIFRALQGMAGALLVPSSLALIISTFSGAMQGKAVGSWTAWTGIAFIVGPLLGGLLVDHASWRWIFAINVLPIALTLYLMSRLTMIKDERKGSRIDIGGALLCAAGLGGAVYALIEQQRLGWSSPGIYLPLAAGVILLVVFWVYENRIKQPMLAPDLFKNHNFSVGNLATLLIYAGLTASTFLIVVFLQQVGGYTALAAGFSLLPVTLILFFFSPRIGALAGKYGPRLFMGFGPIVAGLGFLMMLHMDTHINYWTQLFPGVVIFGIGLAITVAPLVSAILGDVPPAQAGIASAVNNAVARVAGLIAVAAVGAIVAAQFNSTIEHKLGGWDWLPESALKQAKQNSLQATPPPPYQHDKAFKHAMAQASVDGFHAGLITIAGLMFAGGAISLIGITNPARQETSVQ